MIVQVKEANERSLAEGMKLGYYHFDEYIRQGTQNIGQIHTPLCRKKNILLHRSSADTWIYIHNLRRSAKRSLMEKLFMCHYLISCENKNNDIIKLTSIDINSICLNGGRIGHIRY